jgi:hypothetical protein
VYGIGVGGVDADAGAGAGASFNSTAYGSSNFSTVGTSHAGGFDLAAAAFNSADKNKDGMIDENEFRQFYRGGL